MKTEFLAGLHDAKRTTRRSRRHLEMGDLAFKLGYLWGWLTTPAPKERHPAGWTIETLTLDRSKHLVTTYDDGTTSSRRLTEPRPYNNTPEV